MKSLLCRWSCLLMCALVLLLGATGVLAKPQETFRLGGFTPNSKVTISFEESSYPKKNLQIYRERNRRSAEAILLMSCFEKDNKVVNQLRLISQKKAEAEHEVVLLQDYNLRTKAGLVADLALGEFADKDAVRRTVARIKSHKKDLIVFILASLSHIDNKDVINACIPLLRDKRRCFGVGTSAKPVYNRFCDLTYQALLAKVDGNSDFDISIYPYPDADLVRAYNKFERVFRKRFEK